MRYLALLLLFAATPALAQDEPGFLQRLFGTDGAESDADQGTLLERLIEDKLSGAGRQVTITGFRGALSGEATLDTLTIADADGVWLSLTDATLDWNRAALFAGRVDVTELSAREILLPRLPVSEGRDAPTPEAGQFQLPELPVGILIERLAIERVEMGEAVLGVAADLAMEGAFSLADGSGAADLAITRLDRPDAITLDASFENATDILSLDLSMVEEAGGLFANLAGLPGTPSVDFSIAGEGPLSEFAADIQLSTDEVERLAGQITLSETDDARRIVADISGDIAPVIAPRYRDFFGNDLSLTAETLLYADGRVVLPEFSLFARELALFGSVEIGADRLPEKIDVTGRIAPEDAESVLLPTGGSEARIARANLAVTFDAAQSEDWRAVFRLDDMALEGLAVDEVALRATGRIGAGPPASVSGDLAFELTGFETLDGLSEAIGADMAGAARIDWSGGPVTIEDFALRAQDLNASGAATIDGQTISANASLTANRLANFTTILNRAMSGQAQLRVSGDFNPLTQEFDLGAKGKTVDLSIGDPRADAILAGTAQLDVTAVRDTEGLRIDLETLESEAASLTGQANLQSGGSSASLNGRLNETSIVLPGFDGPSNISFSGQEDNARDWTIETALSAPALSANIRGLLGGIYDQPNFQGTLEADSPDLSPFSTLAGRAVTGQLSIRAEGGANVDLTRAIVDASLRGRDITIEGLGTDQLLRGPVTLELKGARSGDRVDIVNASFGAQNLIAQLSGVLTKLTSTPAFEGKLSASSSDLSVFSDLADRPLSGSLNIVAEGGANADLTEARIDATADGQDVAIGLAEVDSLLRGPLNLDIDAARDGDGIDIAAFSMRTDGLSVTTSGQLEADADRLEIEARLNDVAPFVPGFSGALSVIGSIGREAQTLLLDIDATGPGGSRAAVEGTVAQDFSTTNIGIDGTAPLALANRFIPPFSLDGLSSFALRMNGRPALESLSGRVLLTNARLAAPTLPTGLEGISGTVSLSGGQATLDIDSRADSGGRVSLAGQVGLSAPNAAALGIGLARVRLTDPRLYETVLDGQVSINGPLTGGASIAGSIDLGETTIQIPSSGLGGAGAIPEIIHLNETPPVRDTRRKAGLLESDSRNGADGGPNYPLDIRISAPNRIFLRGRGLESEFGGTLRLTGSTANIVPIGAFDLIRGRLDILGRRLALETARITIQGDFIPVLNIRASTKAEDTDINVEVLGPADSPEIRFTSAPELPQEEVLARLIFGRGLETLSPFQAARLALAVRTLAGQGGEGVVGKIRNSAGLADLDVTTNEDGNAAVRAGAYLGENIYSDVTIDSAGETQLNLNLDVTPSLTVRGGVTNEGSSSLGIFFERDY